MNEPKSTAIMTDYTIAIYCFIDDFLKASKTKQDVRRKISDAELMTTALLSARYFYGNLVSARQYMEQHHGMKKLDKSNFIRHLHRLADKLAAIFLGLGQTLKALNTSSEYLIDSFPIAVCKNIRIPRCKLLHGEAYRGYNASKKEYFYGFKVTVITTSDGIPVEYYISGGAFHDVTAFQAINIDLPENSQLYADSAYTDYELEDLYAECEHIGLLVERKSHSKRADSAAMKFIKKCMRKRIETTFSGVAAFFPKAIHAVTPQGFILKLTLFLFAYTIDKVI